MKFINMLNEHSLNESLEILLNSKTEKKPTTGYKLSFYFHARELKNNLKNATTTEQMENIINAHSKSGSYVFDSKIKHEGNEWFLFKSRSNNLWISTNYNDADKMYKLRDEFPIGTILVHSWGYDMVLYTFYRIDNIDKKSITLSELENKEMGKDVVKPSDKVKSTKVYRLLNIPTGGYRVKLDSNEYLYIEAGHIYNKDKKYQEDRYD